MFRGEFPDPEIWEDCHGPRWMPWVQLFLPLINNHHGFFQHFPFPGSYMEQPGTTMRILLTIQAEYYKFLEEKNRVPGVR